jgi:hypothetical protein
MEDARQRVIDLSELNPGRSKYMEFVQALDMYGLERETVARTDLLIQAQQLRATIAKLEARSERLGKLEAAGVDNWEGYGFALRDEEDDES